MNKECTPFVVKIKGGRYWHSSTCFYFPRLSFYSDAIFSFPQEKADNNTKALVNTIIDFFFIVLLSI